MSYQTDKSFAYYHQGRIVEIYRITSSINGQIATLAGHKMVVPNSSNTSGIEYPDEDILNGIRVEYTSLEEPFVVEDTELTSLQYSASTIYFNENNIQNQDVNGNNVNAFPFAVGDKVRIQGSKLNDGYYTLTGASIQTLVTSGLVNEEKAELITITQVPESVSLPTELSHINLNRLLSLAIVDYLKASFAEREGDLERKEYYMKQFSKKVSDNESNKNKIYMVQSTSFAVK
jgi:hypothetical protein|tara:strand:+ start:2005 stop:2700 length:696 start_codon:yes stop_codon:yes gene_type:complete